VSAEPSAPLELVPATELLERFRRRAVSPVEVVDAVLATIDRADSELNAFCLVDPEQARAAARASEGRWERGGPCGLLDGVPVAIKDLLLTRGWPTLRGSLAIDPEQSWDDDAPSVARLRAHGAVLVGKTTTPELGWKGVTDSPRDGVTGNPWDSSRTAGGSSGGSAAAVARGMATLAVGTDGGGSIRIPAAFCGVFGLKPTYGRVPLWPASPFGTLAHHGPIARTVEDAALMMDVLAEFDSRDWSAMPTPTDSHRTGLDAGVRGLRIGYSPALGYVDVDPEVAALVRDAVDALAGLGATVDEVDPGFADPVEAFHVLWFSGAAASVDQLRPEARPQLDPGLLEIAELGRRTTALQYLEATAERVRLGALMGRFHETYDLLVTPTLPITAFAAGTEVPLGSVATRWTSWTPFTYPFNLTQQPAASIPCGLTSAGLPVGLHVVGARHADALVLAACRAYETSRPWPQSMARSSG